MAALPAGVEFGLSSESTYKEGNKEVVFVKLTDSALKAIEDFIKSNKDKLNKPKIQFLPGNEGKFTIPVASSGNGTASEVTFQFNVNSNMEMEGPQGSFECVRRNGARRLESCGPLPRRMRVQANDDSYVATKDRMVRTVAAEHSKCTRVIKPNQTDIGRRVKVRASHHPTSHQSSSSSSYSSSGASLQQQVAERAERDRTERDRAERSDRERADRPDRERPDRPDRERPERPSDRIERPAAPPPAARSQPAQPPHQNHPQHPQQSQHPQQQQRPPPNPDLTRRSIKERLIQLLALKPFKKPELYARLISEGIKDRERSIMNKILTDICALKDNCYHLRRHIWNDVNEDWPFYTEDEKRMLKRRKPQNLTPPLSSDSANSLSPRASPGGKRPCPGGGEEAPAPLAKKQRISHYRRPSPPSSGYATGSSGASSGERHASDNEDDRTVKKDNGYTLSFNTVKEICPSPVKTNGFRNSPPVEQTNSNHNSNISNSNNAAVKEDSNAVSLDNPELAAAPDENMTDLEDIERQYPPVTSLSARRAYKSEFAELYKEYVALYQIVSQVVDFFTQLEQELNSARPNSQEYQNVKHRIFTEYRRMKNRDYVYQKRRMNYLHRKLNHIKRMVQQYDDMAQRTQSERTSTASTTQAY